MSAQVLSASVLAQSRRIAELVHCDAREMP